MSKPVKQAIVSTAGPSGTGPYPPALVVGDMVYVSGQGPLDPVSHKVTGDTFAEQMRLTFQNVAAHLAAAGSSLEDAVKINVYLADPTFYNEYNALYRDLVPEPWPARTTIACTLFGIMIEVDCTAMRKNSEI